MSELRFTILGCGSSGGVPRLGGHWGECAPANPRNTRRRCSMLVERDGFRFLKGEVAAFAIPTESKSNKLGLFCGKCGTRIANDTEGRPALSLKAGTLDDRARLRPVGHIWTRSAQAWMTFDENALTYDKAPDDSYYALMERWAAQEHAS